MVNHFWTRHSAYYRFSGCLTLVSLVIIVGLIVVIVAIWFRQRYKLRELENRQLRDSLRQETLIYNMNLKNFENDIKHKDCEISSSTLLLANKNEVLQQISDIKLYA